MSDNERIEIEERISAELEDFEEALSELLAASTPYVTTAAPHEQLSGEDLRNFDELMAARAVARRLLAEVEEES